MRFVFSLICLITFNISAQEVKILKIEDKYSTSVEEISVLASDETTKHGEYRLYEYDRLNVTGYYSNNQKDSTWKEYDYKGKKVVKEYNYRDGLLQGEYKEFFNDGNVNISGKYNGGLKEGHWDIYDSKNNIFESGDYSKGKEIGIWEFYNNGTLFQKYNFDTDLFILNNDTDVPYDFIFKNFINTPNDTVDVGPIYIGGNKHLLEFIATEINYPRIARDNGIEGTVFTVLTIDINGELADIKIHRGIGAGCDEEAFRVLKLTSGRWHPAQDDSKPVISKITIPIKFSMN